MRNRYGWRITRDHLDDVDVTIVGPRDIIPDIERCLERGEGRPFRIYDDDGELYYSGRYVDTSMMDSRARVADAYVDLWDEAFGPLDDYGAPNAGAVRVDYRNRDGSWSTL